MTEKQATILIVDDEQAIIKLLRSNLVSHGYKTLVAMNGTEALSIIERELPDLIILDIMMPKVDGYTACAEIKTSEITKGIMVIMLISLANEFNKKHAQESGADGYITKPLNLKELRQTVENFLGTSH